MAKKVSVKGDTREPPPRALRRCPAPASGSSSRPQQLHTTSDLCHLILPSLSHLCHHSSSCGALDQVIA